MEMVGESICGKRRDRQHQERDEVPAMATAAVSRMVAIGRRIAGAERFMPSPSAPWGGVRSER